ncbi:MAG TPA: nickel-dependent hydrogenase large subunit, partial [Symbiobacteriaceae bacterium]|nr:nickel-dependent hydrogenase large subunit [Symbiobacteriaceae bacterium]
PETEHVALRHPEEYPLNEGRLVSTGGLNIEAREYRDFIVEQHVPPSHALLSSIKGRGSFLVGPLARLNLNADRLSPRAKKALERTKLKLPHFNPFASILARAVELVQLMDESLALIERYQGRPEPIMQQVWAGEGASITEASRGSLYHGYTVNASGIVEAADIVAPTSHNAHNMEDDLRVYAESILHLPEDELKLKLEMLVRAYDPCFSCSTHFLKLNVKRP